MGIICSMLKKMIKNFISKACPHGFQSLNNQQQTIRHLFDDAPLLTFLLVIGNVLVFQES